MDKTKSSTTATSPSDEPLTIAAETDRIYTVALEQAITVLTKGDRPRFRLERDMLPDAVVWNPWEAKAKSMADLGPEDAWRRFLCVEAGSVSRWNTLDAGDSWEGGQRIRAIAHG